MVRVGFELWKDCQKVLGAICNSRNKSSDFKRLNVDRIIVLINSFICYNALQKGLSFF
jgi:hypothetical protein